MPVGLLPGMQNLERFPPQAVPELLITEHEISGYRYSNLEGAAGDPRPRRNSAACEIGGRPDPQGLPRAGQVLPPEHQFAREGRRPTVLHQGGRQWCL